MYQAKLDLVRTERAIKLVKDVFESNLAGALNLTRISAPLFVAQGSGLNDNLNGVERPVSFDVKATGARAEVVHSLAKWKRYALAKYRFPELDNYFPDEIAFVTTQELEDAYPDLTPKERERACVKEYGAAFIMCIGGKLRSGQKHDGRSPDYDDWNLNGDIVLYYPPLDCAFELSSMGIRVDEKSLLAQLEAENCLDRLALPFHKALAAGELPLTMGGGIGQSRLCMFLLNKVHVGEVQVSVWDEKTEAYCREHGIVLM